MDAKKFSAFPKHLYHATKAPVIAHNSEEMVAAVADSYSEKYIPQEYPKMVNGVEVKSKAEEAALSKPKAVEVKPKAVEVKPKADK